MGNSEHADRDHPAREDRARSLLASTADTVSVDHEKLWHDVELALESKRRGWLRPSLAAAAAALVVGGAVAVAGWDGRAVTAGPAGSGTTATTSSPTPSGISSASAPSAVASAAASSSSSLPVLHPGTTLPSNQRQVDLTGLGWQHSPKGRTIGLGTLHLGGRPANLVLAPATLDPHASADRKPHPAACLIVQPAKQPINTWQTGGVVTTCVAFPVPGGKGPLGRDNLGEAVLADSAGGRVDELDGLQWPVVAASKDVATVDFVQDGRRTRLPYRLTLPGVEGAVFTGFLPYEPITAATSTGYDLRDAAGQVVFSGRY